MIDFDEAIARLAAAVRPLGSEMVPLGEAQGRILAEPVDALVASPPADAAAMDGYAVRDADLAALPARLRILGAAYPGAPFDGKVEAGTTVRIFTGAAVPAGTDRVVVQEDVTQADGLALFETAPGPGRHVRRAGSDFACGDRLVEAGRRLDPRAMVAAAGADRDRLAVRRRPRVSLLATGDELAEPGSARMRPHAIAESVSFGVAALVAESGGILLSRTRLRDDLAQMERAAGEAVAAADLVIVTGGASVGERDFAKAMFAPHGLDLLFSKVAMKPGKPVWLGRAGGALVLGLPGNPTSAMVTARLFLAPLLAAFLGQPLREALAWREAQLGGPAPAVGARETFARARRSGDRVLLLDDQDSSAQRSLAAAELLVRRPAEGGPLEAGASVTVLDF